MKITLEQQQKGKDMYQSIVNKAWKDNDFKNELIKNPKSTFEKMGAKLKTNVTVVAEDQSDQSIIYLNIPKKINIENFELTDEQLELVAGGNIIYDAAHWFFGGMWEAHLDWRDRMEWKANH